MSKEPSRLIPPWRIRPSTSSPRRIADVDPESIARLAATVAARGVIQPLVVRPFGDEFELVVGLRRWMAVQRLLERGEAGTLADGVPCLVRAGTGLDALLTSLVENLQREELNPIEEAEAYRKLRDHGLTHAEIGDEVGRSRPHVTNLLRLLELDPDVQQMLINGLLEAGKARALLPLSSGSQRDFARLSIRHDWNARTVERKVADFLSLQRGNQPVPARKDPNVARLERVIQESIGLRAEITTTGSGLMLRIECASDEEFEGLLERMRVPVDVQAENR